MKLIFADDDVQEIKKFLMDKVDVDTTLSSGVGLTLEDANSEGWTTLTLTKERYDRLSGETSELLLRISAPIEEMLTWLDTNTIGITSETTLRMGERGEIIPSDSNVFTRVVEEDVDENEDKYEDD